MANPRQQRREANLLQAESRWLQKALFTIGKVRQSREKLAEARGESHESLEVRVGNRSISIDDVEGFLRQRAEVVNEELGIGSLPTT